MIVKATLTITVLVVEAASEQEVSDQLAASAAHMACRGMLKAIGPSRLATWESKVHTEKVR